MIILRCTKHAYIQYGVPFFLNVYLLNKIYYDILLTDQFQSTLYAALAIIDAFKQDMNTSKTEKVVGLMELGKVSNIMSGTSY